MPTWIVTLGLMLALFISPAIAQESAEGITKLLQQAPEPDETKQEQAARDATALTLAKHPSPSDWDTAFYLPYAVPNYLLARFVGMKLTYDVSAQRAFQVEITKAELTGAFFQAGATIGLRVSTGVEGVSAELVAGGRLLFQGFAQSEAKTTSAAFAVVLDPPTASATVGGQTAGAADAIKKLVDSGALHVIEERLRFAIPIPVEFSQKLGYQGESLLATDHDKGWVKIGIDAPGATLQKRASPVTPVFVPSGLWLGLDVEGATAPAAAPLSDDQLTAALAAYEVQGGPEAKLVVKGGFLAGVFNALGALSPKQREATATIADHGGNLFDSGGDVYAKVGLQDNSGGATLSIAPSATWSADGLAVSCAYDASAHANLHVHVDPGPTGGVGTSIGCSGASHETVKATLGPWLMQDDAAPAQPGKVLSLRANFAAQEIHVDAKTDGKCKFKVAGGWESITVPAFGARVTLPVPRNIVPSLPLLTDEPHAVSLLPAAPLPGGFTLQPPPNPMPSHMVITPGDPVRDAIGYVIPFRVAFAQLDAEEVKQRREAVQALLHAEARPQIKLGKIEIFFGGVNLTPLVDVVKAIVSGVKAAADAGKVAVRETAQAAESVEREAKKLAEAAPKEFGRAANIAGREVGKVAADAGRGAGAVAKDVAEGAKVAVKNFANGAEAAANAAAKAADDAAKAAGKAAEQAAKAAAKATDDAAKVAAKAAEDAAKAAENAAKAAAEAAKNAVKVITHPGRIFKRL